MSCPSRRSSSLQTRVLLALVAVLGGTPAPGSAQSSCQIGLRDAEKSYAVGLFAAVPGQLAPCFKQGTSRTDLTAAYSLLARSYLAADEPAQARQAVSDLLRTDSAFEPGEPPRFAQLVAQVRREQSAVQVTSVSKSKESLREAPATVLVVTAEEIERRGYLDLEQVLHDLPGFDISRTGDTVYSSIFQRGFHAQGRNLILLDGVEQNDLSSNDAQLSRQYALSNVDRVEVVYGPASTMYGANAFTGVINVITKEPEALVAENRRLGVAAQAAGGGLNTRYADLTLAGRDGGGIVSWSMTGRLYHDDNTGLSRFPQYRYDFSAVDYRSRLRFTGIDAQFFDNFCTSPAYYTCVRDAPGKFSVEVTPAGEDLARRLDRQFLAANRFRFSAPADDWSVYGKLRVSNLVLGIELWRTQEGMPALGSLVQDGHSSWAPRQTHAYLKYVQPVSRELTFNAFFRYQQSGLDAARSRIFSLQTYANGPLTVFNLPTLPQVVGSGFRDSSSEFHGELNLVYEASPKLTAVGGLEFGRRSVQSVPDQFDTTTGEGFTGFHAPFQIEHTDLAAYLQASYRVAKALKLVLAGRLNYNAVNTLPIPAYVVTPSDILPTGGTVLGRGYGTVFSPRAAAVYSPSPALALKAVYSEAFKDPTDAEKYGTITSLRLVPPNVELKPERVRNYELGASWQPRAHLALQASAYQSRYGGLVALAATACGPARICGQYHNSDDFRIRGFQVDGHYRLGGTEISGNYTFTSPFKVHPLDAFGRHPLLDAAGRPIGELRVGDIASHHVNLGVNRDWPRRLNTDLRLRYVGPRPTGRNTTDSANPLDHIASHTEVQATVSYRGVLPGTTLQLIVDNLFGRLYYDPGTEPILGVASVPQPGRTIYLRLISGLGRPLAADRERGGGTAAP
jgi:outer membrane receptor for ferrienterochelin and colicins